jgi:hypothetical protein
MNDKEREEITTKDSKEKQLLYLIGNLLPKMDDYYKEHIYINFIEKKRKLNQKNIEWQANHWGLSKEKALELENDLYKLVKKYSKYITLKS